MLTMDGARAGGWWGGALVSPPLHASSHRVQRAVEILLRRRELDVGHAHRARRELDDERPVRVARLFGPAQHERLEAALQLLQTA